MRYPEQHAEIVGALLRGRFITDDTPLFLTLSDHQEFYQEFFHASYGYELHWEGGYCYLSSKETKETASRDLLLFLAVLAYEFHNDQKDIIDIILHKNLVVAEIETYLTESTQYDDLIRGTHAEDLKSFLDYWKNRNLLAYNNPDETTFRFKKPIKTFLDVAAKLSESHLQVEPEEDV